MKPSQTTEILNVLSDHMAHSSFELVERVYHANGPTLARLGARIWDLRQKGWRIDSWRDQVDRSKHWYCLRPKELVQLELPGYGSLQESKNV